MKTIVLIIDYFSEAFPDWFPVFIESCRKNPTINWIIHTNCIYEYEIPRNVEIILMSEYQYCKIVSEKLGIYFYPFRNYKIVDIKPAYGKIWEDEIINYDFWGYSDIDIVYGNLRHFLTDDLLSTKDIISTHDWCFAGHFSIFVNKLWTRNLFRKIKYWKEMFSSQLIFLCDEKFFVKTIFGDFLNIKFLKYFNIKHQLRKYKVLLKEMWTTPLTKQKWYNKYDSHPSEWYYTNGILTNNVDDNEHIYFHFMNYKNTKNMDEKYGKTAPWENKTKVNFVPQEYIDRDLKFTFDGIFLK